MAQQTINIGASPNDGTGTPLRTAFQYTNSNFSELYTAVGPSGNNIVVPGTATITGDLTVDTSTFKVDSTNNRVGINTATPVAGIALHVCDNVFGANLSSGVRFGNSGNNYYFDQLIVTDGSANPSYQLKFTNQTLSRYLFGGGANYWEWYANNTLGMTLNTTGLGVGVTPITQARLSLKSSAGSPLNLVLQNRDASQNWQFYVDGVVVGDGILTINNGTSSVMQMTPTGNVGIGVAPSAGGGCLQLKSGITFPATQVASSDANTLDDYEEGTFIATLKGSTTDPTTPVTVTARYTKIGRVVNVIIYFGNVNTTGASGAVQVIGLPFTSGGGPFYAGSAVSGDTATFTGTLGAWIAPASTQVDVLASASGGSITGATHNAGAGRYLALNITYTV